MGTRFDEVVSRATAGNLPERNLLPVVEKEILHHDILREMQENGLLRQLTFFGGTSLRLCHGSSRLSEDLDFKGGKTFTSGLMDRLPGVLETGLARKYGLDVSVEEPRSTPGNTDTWTIRVVTRPTSKSEKQQRISIDICTLVCYDREPQMLANHYATDLGTTGLILQVQSKRETFTDKLLAFALRNRIKARDLWDLAWLKQTLVDTTPIRLVEKTAEHRTTPEAFLAAFEVNLALVRTDPATAEAYRAEMARFLPSKLLETALNPEFWVYTGNLLEQQWEFCRKTLKGEAPAAWKM